MKVTFQIAETLSIVVMGGLLLAADDVRSQVDPSSALLLRSSGKAPTKEDLDSSRYQVREQPRATTDDRRLLQSAPPQPSPAPPPAPTPPGLVAEPIETPSKPTDETQAPTTQPSSSFAVGDVLLGGSLENIHEYRQKIGAEDYRQNIVDLSFEPIYIYNDSTSNFWLRDYTTSAPGLNLMADVWITPFFGFHTSYQTSFNSSISKEYASTGRIPIQHEWFQAGLHFRKFFGEGKQASGVHFGIDFSEYQMKLEKSSMERMGLKSSGIKLEVEALIPKNDNFQWSFGFSFMPRVDHKQVDAGANIQSGENQESTRMGVHLGGRFLMSRKHQYYWKLSHEVEKNLFEGTTSTNDPRTLAPVEGVEVTNGITIFSIGYTWGN